MTAIEQERSPIVIRPPAATDAEALSILVAQLGYPAPAEEIPGRIERLAEDERVLASVAVLDERVRGLVTAHAISSIHSSVPVAWLTTLVVAEDARERGIGAALVRHAEQWAIAKGARRIAVTSALHRTGAHEFYERLGYSRTGVRLGRLLGES